MANKEHLRQLKQGVEAWNRWRTGKIVNVDLSDAQLKQMDLSGASLWSSDFSHTSLSEADFRRASIGRSTFYYSDLSSANLRMADLGGANIENANFENASLVGTLLGHATIRSSNFRGVDFTSAHFHETVLVDVDLRDAVGLDRCVHWKYSTIDIRTLQNSGPLPLHFLRGVGLPEVLINYLPSILNESIQHYSCFISYSAKDQDLASRLHADLQNSGVRCWFAPHDMPIGGKILDEIDSAIRLRDKLLLILSEHSIRSDWVEDEVTKAFEEERKRGQAVLFPIRLDDAVMDTDEAWAAKLRARHIGDFTRWKEHDEYQKSFARVLRDLTVKKP
jgi:TIR domain-containing protein/pentapeptide repeat protein